MVDNEDFTISRSLIESSGGSRFSAWWKSTEGGNFCWKMLVLVGVMTACDAGVASEYLDGGA